MKLALQGKSVLITGASRGIGAAMARAFASEGCDLHLVARTGEDLDATSRSIEEDFAVPVTQHLADVSVGESVKHLVALSGTADVLVNNAGAIPPGDLEVVDEATWREAWDLKVFGYINMARAFYARMKDRGHGVIINVIGNRGEHFDANYIAGTTGNAALMAFTRALGGASLDHGVRVVGINPGDVKTDRLVFFLRRSAAEQLGDENRWHELLTPHTAEPDEIAQTAVFLASDRASKITGSVITVDGGMSARYTTSETAKRSLR